DLLDVGALVRFRHPLVRSAIYQAAAPEERRGAHGALAAATDPRVDPDRRAWHAAQASAGPDEDIAAELDSSAVRARARGGLAAAAAFLERAAELTPEPAPRAERTLAAAQATYQAGGTDPALRLLSRAEACPLDALQRARLDLLRAQIAFTLNPGRDAPPLLLRAAKQLEPLDSRLARETYLDAINAAMFAGPLATGNAVREAARAARDAPSGAQPPSVADLLLDAWAVRFTEGYGAGMPMLRRALDAFRSPKLPDEDGLRWLWLAWPTARDLWDDETFESLAIHQLQRARDAGALTALPIALAMRVAVHVYVGDLAEAASLSEEIATVTEAIGSHTAPYGVLLLAAWQGREQDVLDLLDATIEDALTRGEGIGLTVARWTRALLDNSLGRYEDAFDSARQASEHPEGLGAPAWGALVELVEAAARRGEATTAADALTRLTTTTRTAGTEWALGIEARCRALVSHDQTAETAYQEAIERLGRTRIRGELARAHLLYGEWLRREGRRLDSRAQLRTAHDMFTAMGMEAFAQRTARELQATGETARKRIVAPTGALTAQEDQIARLAREGLTNPEIGTRLFLSPRTVEWHLGNIFSKLDITSRRQLRR
ncbi:LuxR C-terminal-related transcriptional regulator, partial [Pseudonocardia yunnanensis]